MSTIDEKVIVFDNGLDVMEKRLHRALFMAKTTEQWLEAEANYGAFLEQYGTYGKIAKQLNHNSYERAKRVRERTADVIKDGKAIWLTLSFSDDVLAQTSKETRRKYVARFLKGCSDNYVAHKDFGNDNVYIDRKGQKRKGTKREHYHALVKCEKVALQGWIYGVSLAERVRNQDADVMRTSKYIVKLAKHALKETAQTTRLIYSRPSSN